MRAKQLIWQDDDEGSLALSQLGNFAVLVFSKHIECEWLGENGRSFYTRCVTIAEAKAKCQEEFQCRVFDLLEFDLGPQRSPTSSARIHTQTKAVVRELDTIADHWHARQEKAHQRKQEDKRLGIHGLSEDLVNRFHRSAADNINNKAE